MSPKGAAASGLPGSAQRAATIALLKAIAHDSRLLVLIALERFGPMSAGALQEMCGLEQSAMSHQLGVLKQARLVIAERAGKHVIYSLADHHVTSIVEAALNHAGERLAPARAATSRTGSGRRRRRA